MRASRRSIEKRGARPKLARAGSHPSYICLRAAPDARRIVNSCHLDDDAAIFTLPIRSGTKIKMGYIDPVVRIADHRARGLETSGAALHPQFMARAQVSRTRYKIIA